MRVDRVHRTHAVLSMAHGHFFAKATRPAGFRSRTTVDVVTVDQV